MKLLVLTGIVSFLMMMGMGAAQAHAQAQDQQTILINTTSLQNCMEGTGTGNPTDFCALYTITENSTTCKKHFVNQTVIDCPVPDGLQLNSTNFVDGKLLADTKFGNEYTLSNTDAIRFDNNLQVDLDFDSHTQGDFEGINSPRIDIKRLTTVYGSPEWIANMHAAKSQIITWHADIKDFFTDPVTLEGYRNETYVSLQFNTGRHGSQVDAQEFAFGALFDVSGQSTPKLFEYKEQSNYVKYDYRSMRDLAGNDFVFHYTNTNAGPSYLNNLINTSDVRFKVVTELDSDLTRSVHTFINDEPYWSLDNVSKLVEHDGVKNDYGFLVTAQQGSGHVLARTDNIETHVYSFGSQVLPVPR